MRGPKDGSIPLSLKDMSYLTVFDATPGKDEGTLAELWIKVRETESVGGSVFHGIVDLGKDTHETTGIRATGGCAL